MANRRRLRPSQWAGLIVGGLAILLAGAWLVLRVPDIEVATLRAKYGGPPSQFVEVLPGLTVHLRDEGPRDAPVLVLLHGSDASLHTWQPWVDRLSGRFRIVRFDLPGHGLTGPDPKRDYSTAHYVAVVDAVARALQLQRFALAGNSMGGGVAWRYAAAHPDTVSALILVDASGAPYKGGDKIPLGFRLARLPVVQDVVGGLLPRSLVASSLRGVVSNQAIVTPAMIDRYWELLRYPGERSATIDRLSLPYPQPAPDALQRLTMPTLILWGREDRVIPVASTAWFQHGIPQSRTIVYDHVGHLPMEEVPDRSAAEVAAFLTATAASSARDSAPSPRVLAG